MYKKWNVKFNLLCTFGSFPSFSWRWARNPLCFVSFGFFFHLFEPLSWFSPEVLWLSVTNPVILPWHSYWCWAVLSIQSLSVSCMENSTQLKKNRCNSCQYLWWNEDLHSTLLEFTQAFGNSSLLEFLKEGTWGTCNKPQQDGLCILCCLRSQVLKVSDAHCALDRVEIPILI